ncbi:MAG: hypothetical protein JO106_13985 [Mycobacterium sp.]|nr:hypothetical protein [Mycobacterium sp.]
MGDRLDLLADRQHPDLTATKPTTGSTDDTETPDPAVRIVVLTLLAVDGILSALAGALLLPAYIGSIPFPISALISGLVNAALVWAATRWTTSARVAALPLWTWLLTVAAMTLGGPGDDIIFDDRRLGIFRTLLLITLGIAPPVWVLWRRRPPTRPVESGRPAE